MWYRISTVLILVLVIFWAAGSANAASIPVDNASFESPVVPPDGFPALPWADLWRELDLDPASQTTGVFLNTDPCSPDHIINADEKQLAFLGSQLGNGFEQDLAAVYQVGFEYRLTVGVGVSTMFPPSDADTIEVVLYYLDNTTPVDIVQTIVPAVGLSNTMLQDFEVVLPLVQTLDAWASQSIGVAVRATGNAGGFWNLDHVRLTETLHDFTGDQKMTVDDFSVISSEWLLCSGVTADLTGEGCVDVLDYQEWLLLWTMAEAQ